MKQFVSILMVLLFSLMATHVVAKDAVWIVKGHVYEKGSNSPLPSARFNVREHSANSGTTDKDGLFTLSFSAVGHYTLSVYAAGYESSEAISFELKEGKNQADLDLYLLPATTLEEVVVYGERTPEKLSKTVLTGKELRQAAGTMGDPLRALQSLPGVAMGSDGNSEPAIRGSGPRDNAYFADSIPIGRLFNIDGTSIFHASLINDFTLYNGVFAPYYPDKIGGVLDVSLRDPRTDKVGGIVGFSLIMGASVLLEGPVNKDQSFYFAARRSYLDVLLGKISDKGVTVQLPNYSNYQGKYLWHLNQNQRLSLYVSGTRDKMSFSISDSAEEAQSEPVLAGNSNISGSFDTQALVLDSIFSATTYNKLIVGRSKDQSQFSIGSAAKVNLAIKTSYLREQFNFEPVKNHDVILSANLHDIAAGVDLDLLNPSCNDFKPNCDLSTAPRVVFNDRFSNKPWDISARDRWLVLPSVTLIGGVRQSHDTFLKQVYTEPRLGIEWAYSERTTFNTGWGKHNQSPQYEEILPNLGNPELRHMRSEQSVVGLTHTYNDGWSLKTEAYYKSLSDFVVSNAANAYTNGGSGRAYGFELLLKKTRTENISGWFALTASKSELRNNLTGETFNFNYDQPLNATLVGNYKFNKNMTLGARWTAHTGNPFTPVIGTNGTRADGRFIPVYGALNSERFPNYHRLDLRVDRAFNTAMGKLTLFIDVINVYNNNNIAGYTYNPDHSRRTPVTQLPFFPSIGVEMEF